MEAAVCRKWRAGRVANMARQVAVVMFGAALLACGGGGGTGDGPAPDSQAPVSAPPAITAQPQPSVVNDGASANFMVTATGSGLAYQWLRNGTNIAGASAASYTVAAAALADTGTRFAVVVSNTAGTVTSNEAVLTVRPVAPTITAHPAAAAVAAGATATFSVVAAGSAPLSYQWSRSGVEIAGATAAIYTTPATSLADSGATFVVRVSNAGGQIASQSAVLTVTGAADSTSSLAVARALSLAVRNDGTVIGWGDNSRAQLSTGPLIGTGPARQITSGAAALAATENGGAALRSAGTVIGWGTNAAGWLGGQGGATHATPVTVNWPRPVAALTITDSTGFSANFHYAVLDDGTVWHLPGTETTSGGAATYTARQVDDVSDIVQLSRGQGVAHAIRRDGTVWRLNMFAVIGTPFQWRASGMQVTGLPPIKEVACSEVHCLALGKDGSVWAWGEGRNGELGHGFSFSSITPVRATNLSTATHVAAGGSGGLYSSLARTADGRVWSWGSPRLSGRGLIGSSANVPTEATSLASSTEVVCSSNHCLSRKDDGSVWGWGSNAWGELGVSGTPDLPVQVPGVNLN